MSEPRDMDAPVTRRELYEALEIWAGAIVDRLEQRFATKDDLQRFATKDDLQRFATKDDLQRFATKDDLQRFATKDDLQRFATKDDLAATEARLSAELRQHTRSSETELATRLVAVDEQYKDLPVRVTRLEAKVFAPPRRRRIPRRR
jgi:hypothetical protein